MTEAEQIEQVARLCHEVNRNRGASWDSDTQVPWADASETTKELARLVAGALKNDPTMTAEQLHGRWLEAHGDWAFGELKDAEAKLHPLVRPWAELPPEQREKYAIVVAVGRDAFEAMAPDPGW